MQKSAIATTDQVVTSGKSKRLPNTKHGSKKINEGQIRSRSDSSKIMELQDALQDPITAYEGF